MLETGERRSDRISAWIAIEVEGDEVYGRHFSAQGETIVLSRHGAAIAVDRRLELGQELTISYLAAKRKTACRVLQEMPKDERGWTYGISFLDPNVDFWGIIFPPYDGPAEEGVGRALLQCESCGNRQVIYMNEFEVVLFETNRNLTLWCKNCREPTRWGEVEFEIEAEVGGVRAPVVPTKNEEAAPEAAEWVHPEAKARTKDERKHARVRLAITVCVRRPGFEEEVLRTENVSRGGFCFRSLRDYPLGCAMEVALPYTEGSANIFMPARIVRARALAGDGRCEYGVLLGHGARSLDRTESNREILSSRVAPALMSGAGA